MGKIVRYLKLNAFTNENVRLLAITSAIEIKIGLLCISHSKDNTIIYSKPLLNKVTCVDYNKQIHWLSWCNGMNTIFAYRTKQTIYHWPIVLTESLASTVYFARPWFIIMNITAFANVGNFIQNAEKLCVGGKQYIWLQNEQT